MAARTYHRDARGRFASSSSAGSTAIRRGAKKASGGTAPARAKLRRAKLRLEEAPSPQRKGAVTRAKRELQAAAKPVRLRVAPTKGRIRPGRRSTRPTVDAMPPQAPVQSAAQLQRMMQRLAARELERRARPGILGQIAREGAGPGSGISRRARRRNTADGSKAIRRRLSRAEMLAARGSAPAAKAAATYRRQLAIAGQGLVKQKGVIRKPKPPKPSARARNNIRKLPAAVRAPKNAIRPYQPVSPLGLTGKAKRILRQAMKEVRQASAAARRLMDGVKPMEKSWAMRVARAIAKRNEKGTTGRIAQRRLRVASPWERQAAQRLIADRAARADAAASRGSRPAARARDIYASQMAGMGPGKPPGGKNNLRPGPRNTKGTPKKRRKRKGKS